MIVRRPSKRQRLSCFWSENTKVSCGNLDMWVNRSQVYDFPLVVTESLKYTYSNFVRKLGQQAFLFVVVCHEWNIFQQFLSLNGDSCWTSLQTSGFQPEAWHQFAGQHSRMHVHWNWRAGMCFLKFVTYINVGDGSMELNDNWGDCMVYLDLPFHYNWHQRRNSG